MRRGFMHLMNFMVFGKKTKMSEKKAGGKKLVGKKSFNRFSFAFALISLFFMFFSPEKMFSQNTKRLTYSQMMALTINPVNERNYAGQECCFELKIPYAKAETVQASIPDLPGGVNFVSLRRSDYSEDESGTKIELWLNFSEAGRYNLRVMRITVNGKIYSLKFPPVEILENPKDMLPQLVIVFDNGQRLLQTRKSLPQKKAVFSSPAGTKLNFTVYLQYAVQLVSFYWSVPKDSLFFETKRFDLAKNSFRSAEFSEELIPVASFEWQPLTEGEMFLPEMRFYTTSYNGTRVELTLPDAFISVTEDKSENETFSESGEKYFLNAFDEPFSDEKTSVPARISRSDCEKIAALRSLERNSFPFSKAVLERKAFEAELGISGEDSEPDYFVFWLFLCLSFLAFSLLFVFIILRKIQGILASATFGMIFLVSSAILLVHLKTETGIFAGGKISPVPEKSAQSVEAISSGKKVRVEQKAGEWIYVRAGSASGWTDSENVILIDKR